MKFGVISIYAILFSLLFVNGFPLGINVFIVAVLSYALMFLAFRPKFKQISIPLILLTLGYSAMFAIFNNIELQLLNVVILVVLFSMQICMASGKYGAEPYSFNFISDIVEMIVLKPFRSLGKVFGLFRGKKTFGILLGIIIAIPVCGALIMLLAWADEVFVYYAKQIFGNVTDIVLYLVVAAGIFLLVSSVIYEGKHVEVAKRYPMVQKTKFNLTAVYILLGAMSVILIIFSIFQFGFLSGMFQLPKDFTYSEYARQGFYQLLVASGLIFTVTALCMKYTKHNTEGKHRTMIKALCSLLCVCGVVLLVSAFLRLVMYENAYYFSRLRIYAQWLMIVLAALYAISILFIWMPKIKLGKCVILTCAVMVLALNIFNVDGFIAQQNLTKKSIAEEDIDYLVHELSTDAFPYYAQRFTDDEYIMKNFDVLSDKCEYILSYNVKNFNFSRYAWQNQAKRLKEICDVLYRGEFMHE